MPFGDPKIKHKQQRHNRSSEDKTIQEFHVGVVVEEPPVCPVHPHADHAGWAKLPNLETGLDLVLMFTLEHNQHYRAMVLSR